MPYQTFVAGRVFVLRWLSAPTSQDLRVLSSEMSAARQKEDHPLVNLSLISTEINMPDQQTRSEMERFHKVFMDNCESIHVVVGGEGFKHAIARSIVSAFALASGRRGLVHVHRSIDDALKQVAELSHQDLATLRLKLVNAKIFNGF
jgi:hypothetical protein